VKAAIQYENRNKDIPPISGISGEEREKKGKQVSRKYLINKINYSNFQEQPLIARFLHKKYGRSFSMEVFVKPCMGNNIEVEWKEPECPEEPLNQLIFKDLFMKDGEQILVITAEEISVNQKGFSLKLPNSAFLYTDRAHSRYLCRENNATILQDGYSFSGTVKNFSPDAFAVAVETGPESSFKWLNPEGRIILSLENSVGILYSSECKIRKILSSEGKKSVIAEPKQSSIQRFKAKEFRAQRFTAQSPVHAVFHHPLTGFKTELKINDISGSGFSVLENSRISVLIPGLILQECALILPGGTRLPCIGQVIHKRTVPSEENNDLVQSGIAILDMQPGDHTILLNFIHQQRDSSAFISNRVDIDALWRFFFESGFIYPNKYAHFLDKKTDIKNTYVKLYTENPGIARHFINQENNTILGHMSMLRTYENTWLIHHHASSLSHNQNAGIKVLHQVGSFANNSHRIQSMHMDYLICFFRPENKFPAKVFGEIAHKINEPKSCSLDTFAYSHFQSAGYSKKCLDGSWTLDQTDPSDLLYMESYYERVSGGLMLDAFSLKEKTGKEPDLISEYTKAGFQRQIHLFSLKRNNELKAVFMVDLSEPALNMSDLTNCVKIFVTDGSDIERSHIFAALSCLQTYFPDGEMPFLINPFNFAREKNIAYEKEYILWVLNTDEGDKYFRHLKGLLKNAGY